MSILKSKMREQTENWLLEYANVKSMTDGLFVTLTIPPDCISPYKRKNGCVDMSNREVCIHMLRRMKNRIKNKFYGRENWRGWFIPVIEGDGRIKNFHFHLLISIPDKQSKIKYRDELREYIENCWKRVVRRNWVSMQIDEGNDLKQRVHYICKDITDLTSDCIVTELLEDNNRLPI
jgi:hypothetical protein